jgi:hypothetical protein
MIKLTVTQAKAVACKIRERVCSIHEEKKQQLLKEYRETDEYRVKRNEAHEACTSVWQASLKLNLNLGVRITCYCGYDLYKEEDVETAEKVIMKKVEEKYLSKVYVAPKLPSEETLTQDLIFESLMSDGIETLMDKFIEKYL